MESRLKTFEEKKGLDLSQMANDYYNEAHRPLAAAEDVSRKVNEDAVMKIDSLLEEYQPEGMLRVNDRIIRYQKRTDATEGNTQSFSKVYTNHSARKRARSAEKTEKLYEKYKTKIDEYNDEKEKAGGVLPVEKDFQLKREALLLRLDAMTKAAKVKSHSSEDENRKIDKAKITVYATLIRLCEMSMADENASEEFIEQTREYERELDEKLEAISAKYSSGKQKEREEKIPQPTIAQKTQEIDSVLFLESEVSMPKGEYLDYYRAKLLTEKDPAKVRGQIDEDRVRVVTKEEEVHLEYEDEDNMVLANLQHPRFQETDACWAFSISLMLRAYGYIFDPKDVRAYIPSSADTMEKAKYFFRRNTTGTGEIADSIEILKHFTTNYYTSEIQDLSKEHSVMRVRIDPKQAGNNYEQYFEDEVRFALKNQSPIVLGMKKKDSGGNEGHYISITGMRKQDNTTHYLVQDSLKLIPHGEWKTLGEIRSKYNIDTIDYVRDEKMRCYREANPDTVVRGRKKRDDAELAHERNVEAIMRNMERAETEYRFYEDGGAPNSDSFWEPIIRHDKEAMELAKQGLSRERLM